MVGLYILTSELDDLVAYDSAVQNAVHHCG